MNNNSTAQTYQRDCNIRYHDNSLEILGESDRSSCDGEGELALQGKLLGVLARDVVLLREVLGGHAHGEVAVGVGQVAVGVGQALSQRVLQVEVQAQLRAKACIAESVRRMW